MRIIRIFMVMLMFGPITTFACHDVTVTETSAIDNGNGTYTYTFDICAGIEQTYGFYLDFNGLGSIVSYTPSVTGPTTLNVLTASVPPISGVGDLEYGDWDNGLSPPFSNGNECTTITVTFDDVINSVTTGVNQQFSGPCTHTTQTTDCFPTSSYTYKIVVDLPNCGGNTDIGFDGVWKWVDIPNDGTVQTLYYCGPCATTMRIFANKFNGPGGCGGGIDGYSVYDATNTLIQSGGSTYGNNPATTIIDVDVSCGVLPIELIVFDCNIDDDEIELYWSTASQINNDYFIIEHSTNGFYWDIIEYIDGAGNSSQIMEYSTTHFNVPMTTNYYRLTQVDYDGKRETFNTVSCSRDMDNKPIENTKYFNSLGQEINKPLEGYYLQVTTYVDGTVKANKRHIIRNY